MYQLPIRCDRKVLRYASADSEIGRIRRFTRRESGRAITWQEAVSLIPAALLAPESDHLILDMCAAPGSKTTALMEYASRNRSGGGDGILIANDLDGKRIQTLVHNLQRVGKNDNLIVTNLSADAFPMPRKAFDRIMCDVPCSGDGTLRKEPSIWTKWSPRNAIALHPVQLAIASRGVCLLKKGGIMAYSTCSLNVIENEAVVAELLRIHKGELELIDMSSKLPRLKRRVGMTQWLVYGDDMSVIERDNVTTHNSMFPPSKKEISWMNLERCLRIVPHDQNTGGFFIAMFRKTAKSKKRKRPAEHKDSDIEDDLKYRKFNKKSWQSIKDYYGITADDEKFRLMTRASGRVGYLMTRRTERFVQSLQDIPVIIAGVKMVERLKPGSTGCDWRLRQEGLETLLPFLSKKRVVVVTRRVFLDLLTLLPANLSSREYLKLLKDPKKCSKFQRISTWKLDDSARTQINLLSPGCFVIRFENLGLVSWLAGGRKSHFSIAHAGMHLQSRIGALKAELLVR